MLRVADGGPFLECEDMASRVQDLISATYRTDDVTGTVLSAVYGRTGIAADNHSDNL